jgi:hypothetical protein
MKKKSSPTKKTAVKKTDSKKKVVIAKKNLAPKKAAVKKATPKKAVPKKAAPRSAGFRDDDLAESFRPICITQGIRLDERCMTKREAFEIAQEHRRNTSPRHRVDVESC